jgi:hypothetical protein
MKAFRVDLIHATLFIISEMKLLFITYDMTYEMFGQMLRYDK